MAVAPTTSPPPEAAERNEMKDALKIWVPVIAICLAALGGTYFLFVDAPPPKSLTIATGGEAGQYFAFGKKYSEWLKENFDIALDVKSTRGTGENLQLLLDPNSGVSVALVQGGVPIPKTDGDDEPLMSLGSLYREPLWVFYRPRDGAHIDLVSELAGMRISVGPRASGTFPVAQTILGANGINIPDADGPDGSALDEATQSRFRFLGGADSAAALKSGEIDAAFIVVGAEAGFIRDLLVNPEVQVLSFTQWESYTRRFPFLSHVVLTRGLIDFGKNIPSEDLHLIAPTATLVVRSDMHPALASLLVQAAHTAHRSGGLLASPDEFPSARFVDLPISQDAELFYKNGPPLLQRWVGFQWGIWLDRIKVMLVPLIMLLLPLFRAAPPLMRWRIRSRIYRWYAVIRQADMAMKSGLPADKLREHLDKLKTIGAEIAEIRVPLSYMDEFYTMRFHLMLVQERLDRELTATTTTTAAATATAPTAAAALVGAAASST